MKDFTYCAIGFVLFVFAIMCFLIGYNFRQKEISNQRYLIEVITYYQKGNGRIGYTYSAIKRKDGSYFVDYSGDSDSTFRKNTGQDSVVIKIFR